jgi:hypothetical protein
VTRYRFLGFALTAALALNAALAGSALALPESLPFSSGTKAFTGQLDSGQAVLENSDGFQFKCERMEGSGGLETDELGTFKFNFEKCGRPIFGGTEPCTGAGDNEGTILSEGSFHYVFDTLGTGEALGVAILLLVKETSFECAEIVQNDIKGDLLCLVLSPLTSLVTHLFHCVKGEGSGEQAQARYWNDEGTAVATRLLFRLNGGEFEETNLQLLATITTKEASAIMGE